MSASLAAAVPPPDPTAGASTPGAGADAGADQSDNVLVTIVGNGDGSYTVYAGDEPDGGSGGDSSDDDVDAMGSGGATPPSGSAAPQGQHADSVGAALKIAMNILNASKSSGASPGDADDQFAAGFGGGSPAVGGAGTAQKY